MDIYASAISKLNKPAGAYLVMQNYTELSLLCSALKLTSADIDRVFYRIIKYAVERDNERSSERATERGTDRVAEIGTDQTRAIVMSVYDALVSGRAAECESTDNAQSAAVAARLRRVFPYTPSPRIRALFDSILQSTGGVYAWGGARTWARFLIHISNATIDCALYSMPGGDLEQKRAALAARLNAENPRTIMYAVAPDAVARLAAIGWRFNVLEYLLCALDRELRNTARDGTRATARDIIDRLLPLEIGGATYALVKTEPVYAQRYGMRRAARRRCGQRAEIECRVNGALVDVLSRANAADTPARQVFIKYDTSPRRAVRVDIGDTDWAVHFPPGIRGWRAQRIYRNQARRAHMEKMISQGRIILC